uniref:peptidylprolyl isomerase n=1 Tax=Octopus bimaculoides TaxID=37653 RepID=A0A0L8I1D2_OCTBM
MLRWKGDHSHGKMAVLLETSLGDLVIDLYLKERPNSCLNFLKLCKVKYYNFCLFHSIQFFITLQENLDYLDGTHTVFGEVTEGFDIVDKINEAYCDKDHRPFRDIRIYHTVILNDPYEDPPHLDIPPMSPVPTKEQLESDRIGDTEDLDDTKGMTEEEMKELMEQKEAKSNAQILEMVGDIPDVDVAPPENVLFVCKLNPVTTEEDLEIIFSRFGNIRSCEVIKDSKTKESLQYAFIEFEKPEECENAYFKMDNVLIDDRRIHVDFSQSVAKLKWKGKGNLADVFKCQKKKL